MLLIHVNKQHSFVSIRDKYDNYDKKTDINNYDASCMLTRQLCCNMECLM